MFSLVQEAERNIIGNLKRVVLFTLVQYTDKVIHGIVKFLIVLLRSLLCFFTFLLSEVNTTQCHA